MIDILKFLKNKSMSIPHAFLVFEQSSIGNSFLCELRSVEDSLLGRILCLSEYSSSLVYFSGIACFKETILNGSLKIQARQNGKFCSSTYR